jgi:hypothetical protein
LAQEFKKQPNLETLSKLFQIGGGATAMAGPISKLVIDNGPTIQRLAEAALRTVH